MTVIEGVEIDHIVVEKENIIRHAILNNRPIEAYLHVIVVISNPCLFRKRYVLAREFCNRMLREPQVKLYIVELCYGNQEFVLTQPQNPRHLQLRAETPIWHKENMINLGVRHLLPSKWRAFAWIDADVEFESPSWVSDTLKILNGTREVVQLFSHCLDLGPTGQTQAIFTSGGFQKEKGHTYCNHGLNFWHPGFAWACNRRAYESMQGLFETAILGSGDNIMMFSFIGAGVKAISKENTANYLAAVRDFTGRVAHLRFSYVPGVIRHYYHGSKKNRKYTDRWKILIQHRFDPVIHLHKDEHGLLHLSPDAPARLAEDIMHYFRERNEDE
jgi:hypothetical protein